MLNKHNLQKVIFLNIETAPQYAKFADMPDNKKALFLKKFDKEYTEKTWTLRENESGIKERLEIQEDLYSKNAALFSEWGKIACISFLLITDIEKNDYKSLSISDKDEKKLLQAFLDKATSIRDYPKVDADKKKSVCSYSGFGFTWPYIAHRCLINGIPIPPMFDYSEGKPWEQDHLISLMNVWNYNRSSSFTSLDSLAEVFDIRHSSYPNQISGWYHSGDLNSLKDYGMDRALTLANCFLAVKGLTNKLINKPK